jgi:sugar lactone lactonase YvrE
MTTMTSNWMGLLVVAMLLSIATGILGQEKTRFAQVGLPEKLVPADAQVGVAATVCFLEGPAFDGEGNLFFSDIAGNRILKMDPSGRVSVFRENSGRTNGNTFDARGVCSVAKGRKWVRPKVGDASSEPTSRPAKSKS